MKVWLRTIARRIERLLRPQPATVDRSRLVGMYLTQANRPARARVIAPANRERQNGKFSQLRRRG